MSRAIKELEADLGINIFERSAKGVTITPAGDEFIGYAKSLLKQIEQIDNILNRDYKLGIIRYTENCDKFFKIMLEEKNLTCEMVTEFTYKLIMSKNNPLAQKTTNTFEFTKC